MPDLRCQAVALLEALDATGGIHDALLAGKEGVALAADVEVDGLLRGARLPGVAAGADNCGFDVVGVDFFFHFRSFSGCWSGHPAKDTFFSTRKGCHYRTGWHFVLVGSFSSWLRDRKSKDLRYMCQAGAAWRAAAAGKAAAS